MKSSKSKLYRSVLTLFVFTISLLIFMQVFVKEIIILHYLGKNEFYAKELCVKRAIPNNCCKGKCRVRKELKSADDHEKRSTLPNSSKNEFVYFSQQVLAYQLNHFVNICILETPYVLGKYDVIYIPFFKPPSKLS